MVPIELLSSESIKSAIDAYAFFQENPDAVDWKGITLKQLLQFIFEATGEQEIQKAIPLLYEIYDKKLQEELNGKSPTIPNATVPAEIKSLLQAWEQFQKAKNKAEQDKLRSQFIYDERILAAKRIKELALEAKTKIEITATPEVDDQISKLKADIQNNPDEFRRIVIQEIKDRKSKISNGQAEKIADTAIQVINSNPYELAVKTALADKESDLLSNLIPDLTKKGDVENVRENLQLSYEEEINNIKVTKQFLIDNAILSIDTIEALMPTESFVTREFAITTNPTTENAVYLNPVEVVKITDPSNPPKAVSESFENLFIPAAGKFTGRPLVTPPAPITNTAAEITFIPTGARIAREQIAKEDPQTATAMILYYEFGVTKGTFETIAKSAGLSNSQIKNFEQRLGEFQNAHPFVAIELARQRAGLTEIQIQGLTQVFKGPQESWYQNTANMAPPITGFQGFVVRAGGQLFGKQIANSFEKSVRNNLAKIAGGEIAKKGKELVAGSLIGRAAGTVLTTFTGGLGAIGSWVLAKAVIGFRSNSGKILGGSGAILGFIAGGPIGALIGAGLGGAIAGVDWKKYAQYALIALTALFSAFLGAIAVPLIIAFVGIPLITALILFIINAGAYVVPPSTGVGGQACRPVSLTASGSAEPVASGSGELPPCPTGCPAEMWPVTTGGGAQYSISQGPGGPTSHGPPAKITRPDGTSYIALYQEAIDIAPKNKEARTGSIVITHPGIVRAAGVDAFGGNFVEVEGTCGPNVRTSYVHMRNIVVTVGQEVQAGTIIGQIGMTGYASGVHLHYEFLNNIPGAVNGTIKKDSTRHDYPPPFMIEPYIPKTVPQFCVVGGAITCNIDVP